MKMHDENSKISYERVLTAIVIVMCAFIVGYNVFYNPALEVVEFNATDKYTKTEVNENKQDSYGNEFSVTSSNKDLSDSEDIKYPININTATVEELSEGLDGIGEAMATRIVNYRDEIGGFSDINQLLDVQGIGEKKFDNIKNYVTVE